jgi:predicted RNA-binding protein YlxR (DUF448 family)
MSIRTQDSFKLLYNYKTTINKLLYSNTFQEIDSSKYRATILKAIDNRLDTNRLDTILKDTILNTKISFYITNNNEEVLYKKLKGDVDKFLEKMREKDYPPLPDNLTNPIFIKIGIQYLVLLNLFDSINDFINSVNVDNNDNNEVLYQIILNLMILKTQIGALLSLENEAIASSGGKRTAPAYKLNGEKVSLLINKKKLHRSVYVKGNGKAKYCKINYEFVLLSKLKNKIL